MYDSEHVLLLFTGFAIGITDDLRLKSLLGFKCLRLDLNKNMFGSEAYIIFSNDKRERENYYFRWVGGTNVGKYHFKKYFVSFDLEFFKLRVSAMILMSSYNTGL